MNDNNFIVNNSNINDYLEDSAFEEAASTLSDSVTYDDKFILKRILEGKSRDDIAVELKHKNYRTLDMYMRRRGYVWNRNSQNYVLKKENNTNDEIDFSSSKVKRIISFFNSGLEPMEIAKKVGMKDHRAVASYMKSQGYIWSPEKQNYILLKGKQIEDEIIDITEKEAVLDDIEYDLDDERFSLDEEPHNLDKLEKLIPTMEIFAKNKDKILDLLCINSGGTIPRYVIGGVTITKSLCMSHNLSEIVKDFSREKNISQREIFEVAIVEFLRKYGYENEINALFGK